jgi:hypothetical protein
MPPWGRLIGQRRSPDSYVLKIIKKHLEIKPKHPSPSILAVSEQIEFWRKAVRKMSWNIRKEEFHRIETPPQITDQDRLDGYIDLILSYGFGDDGQGNADSILSGKTAWDYARRHRKGKTWQCANIHFDNPEYFRLRPNAPPRPKGFYFSKIQTGQRYQNLTVSQVLTRLHNDTCFGPEGIQFLTVTHPHFQDLMNERKIPFMAFGDYDVAPHGFSDFYDSLQMFCSQGILGLGIGNIDNHYPLFGIPTLRLSHTRALGEFFF